MPAVLRIGGELEPGYQNGYAIGGVWDPASVSLIAGRTGGRAWRCASGSGSISGYPDHPNPALIPQVEEDQWMIARFYARINQYPVVSEDDIPDVVPALPIGYLQPTTRGVAILPDGRIGAVGANGMGSPGAYEPDRDVVMPLDEWVMIESAATYSTTNTKQVIRVTLPGEEPVIVYCRSHTLGHQEPRDDLTPILTMGFEVNPGAGFVLDVDDAGINLGGDDAHGTWLGPGAVRNARPNGDLAAGQSFESGTIDDTGRGAGGRTIKNHEVDPLYGEEVETLVPAFFWPTLANDPVLNPATEDDSLGRFKGRGFQVVSSGSDWHKHTSPPAPTTDDVDPVTPGKQGWIYVYDWPRQGFAGDTLEVSCDASDQAGAVSYAMPWVIGTQIERLTDPSLQVEDGSGYMAFYTDFDGPPVAGDETDRAVQNINENWGVGGAIDSAWTAATGRIANDPGIGAEPTLIIRREDAVNKQPEGTSPDQQHIGEFRLIGAGIVYESGFVAQPPIEPCRRLMTFV